MAAQIPDHRETDRPDMKPDKKKWVHGEVRRKQIFDEAILLIGQRGYRGLTLQELAQRCELSNPGLLHHFPSKVALLIAMLLERDRRDNEALRSAGLNYRDREPGDIPLTDIYRMLREIVVRDSERPELVRLYCVLRAESLNDDHPARQFFLDRAADTNDALTNMLKPHFTDAEAGSIARQLIALHGGLSEQWLREERGFDLVAEWDHGAAALLRMPPHG